MRSAAVFPALLLPALAAAQAVVQLHYQERPPYYQTRADGTPHGLVVDPLQQALGRAGLVHRWALTPSQRQLKLIEEGQGLDCGVGWFRNPGREARGQFSRALYRDQALGLLAATRLGWPEAIGLREALARSDARPLLKQGFSYGPAFDAALAESARQPETSSAEVPTLLRMLQAGRADWMPVAPEEGRWLLAQGAEPGAVALRLHRFSDAAEGQSRHLYCNKAVPRDWLRALDAALPP